ncbi:MAG: TetR family transcriptional regulator [Gemmatimonadaceae bacterium]|nr:TetR family transcriptional regulator [Gemmatimonadaceae bacterium]
MADSSTGEITRQRLLHAAFDVFAARGFEAGTVREITDRAGANLAAVSYHFRGKEELYVAVIAQAVLRVLAPLERDVARARTAEQRQEAGATLLRDLLFDDHGASAAMQLVARELAGGSRALRHVLRLAMTDDGVLGRAINPWRRADDTATLGELASLLGAMTAVACLAPPIREPMREEMVAAVQRDRLALATRLASQLVPTMVFS